MIEKFLPSSWAQSDNYVHLEQNGDPGDWLEIPEEAIEKYFMEFK